MVAFALGAGLRTPRFVLVCLLACGVGGAAGCGLGGGGSGGKGQPSIDGMWAYQVFQGGQPAGNGHLGLFQGQLVLLTDSNCDAPGHVMQITASNLAFGYGGAVTGSFRAQCPPASPKPSAGATAGTATPDVEYSVSLVYPPGPGTTLGGTTIARLPTGDVTYNFQATRAVPDSTPSTPFSATPGTCAPSPSALCLLDTRFRVEVSFVNPGTGQPADATPVPIPGQPSTGTFYFFDPNNTEVIIKILNGCTPNNHYWVFYGGLTNVEFTLTVTDTAQGVGRTYFNPAGSLPAAITDTQAFATCP